MNASDRLLYHVALLRALRTKGEIGMPEATLLDFVRMAGFEDTSLPLLQVELRALADRNWIAPCGNALTGARYRATALGESHLAEAGL
jgi:hypothetical protein